MKSVLSYICLEVEDSLTEIKREFIDHSCNPIEYSERRLYRYVGIYITQRHIDL